ncbi:MAG: major coat protein [Marinobacter sp.]|uniref:major coat protein n=1 Tax=Marinobacter sp. TaxID=50741 RepID=UPI0034A0A5FD
MNKQTFVATKIAGVFTVVAASVGNVYAALPLGAATAFTQIQTDGLELIDLAWPLAIALTSAVIVLGLFKKFAKKAAS